MSLKYKLLILLALLAVSFSFGRYSVQGKQVTQSQETSNTGERIHTVTVVTEEHGKKVTQVTEDAVVNTISKEIVKSTLQVVPKRSVLNVSVLGGVLLQTRPELVYGLSVSKEFVGPLTIGMFGLSDGILGLSIGVNF